MEQQTREEYDGQSPQNNYNGDAYEALKQQRVRNAQRNGNNNNNMMGYGYNGGTN